MFCTRSVTSCHFFLLLFLLGQNLIVSNLQAQSGQPINRPADAEYKLSASVRIGLGYSDTENNSGDYAIEDFESRLRWQGSTDLAAGLQANGYIELGLDSEDNTEGSSGIDQTRQLWAGLSGLWGSLRAGAQYGTFYDMVSVHTDLAWVGSCWTQFECDEETRVLKYQTPPSPLVLSVSATATPDDEGSDPADQIEYGFTYQSSGLTFAMAATNYAEEGEFDGGMVVGVVLKTTADQLGLTIAYQQSDRSVAAAIGNAPSATDDVTHLTLGVNYRQSYFIYNMTDTGNSEPSWYTLGATQVLGDAASFFYEYQVVDFDDQRDEDVFFRAGLIYDW